jgi:trimethylamine--corrinoid protein Co-methyltransferase
MVEVNMHSETPDILPFPADFKSKLLSNGELESLKDYTLQLLEEVGVHMPSQRALELFSDHGASVDLDKKIVRIPPDLVKRAMSTAPRTFVLAGREERFDLLLDGNNSYLSTDGCGVHVFDRQSGQQRASKKADVEMMARVCDALPLISFFWPRRCTNAMRA